MIKKKPLTKKVKVTPKGELRAMRIDFPMPEVNPPKKEIKFTDTGSAAALQRWEAQERKDASLVDKLGDELDNLMKLDRDDDEIRSQISRKSSDLSEAKNQWESTSKILLSFDKNVSPEKREGVKLSQTEVESIIYHFVVRLRLATEQHFINIAQDLHKCKNEQEIYRVSADSFRGCVTSVIKVAITEQRLPGWVAKQVESAL